MHSVMVLSAGFVLLALCLLAARLLGATVAGAVTWFLPLWLAATLINMAVGVLQSGYSVAAELPIFLVLFAVPAAAALYLRRRAARP